MIKFIKELLFEDYIYFPYYFPKIIQRKLSRIKCGKFLLNLNRNWYLDDTSNLYYKIKSTNSYVTFWLSKKEYTIMDSRKGGFLSY